MQVVSGRGTKTSSLQKFDKLGALQKNNGDYVGIGEVNQFHQGEDASVYDGDTFTIIIDADRGELEINLDKSPKYNIKVINVEAEAFAVGVSLKGPSQIFDIALATLSPSVQPTDVPTQPPVMPTENPSESPTELPTVVYTLDKAKHHCYGYKKVNGCNGTDDFTSCGRLAGCAQAVAADEQCNGDYFDAYGNEDNGRYCHCVRKGKQCNYMANDNHNVYRIGPKTEVPTSPPTQSPTVADKEVGYILDKELTYCQWSNGGTHIVEQCNGSWDFRPCGGHAACGRAAAAD